MIKLLDKDLKTKMVIVKMDIHTYEEIKSSKPSIKELAQEARNSNKVFHTHEELMAELLS